MLDRYIDSSKDINVSIKVIVALLFVKGLGH